MTLELKAASYDLAKNLLKFVAVQIEKMRFDAILTAVYLP